MGGDTDAVKSGTQMDGLTDGRTDGGTDGRQRQTDCVMIWDANLGAAIHFRHHLHPPKNLERLSRTFLYPTHLKMR